MVTSLLLALLLGVIAGLRAMTPPAATAWAAHLGRLKLQGTWLAFMGHSITPWVLTVLALGELVTDQLPKTPSRKVPVQFGARIVNGAFCGACCGLGTTGGSLVGGVACGVVGAVIGTYAGAAGRSRLAATFGKDPPAAFLEDAVAIGFAALVVLVLT